MRKILKFRKGLVSLGFAALAFSILSTVTTGKSNVHQVSAAENIVYYEDFADTPDGDFGTRFNIEGGKGRLNTTSTFDVPVPTENLLASNNYEISFELKIDAPDPRGTKAHLQFRLLGLDAGVRYIYFDIRDDGQYWAIVGSGSNNAAKVYNNSGLAHGGLNTNNWNLLVNTVQVKLVVFEGYLETWVNNQRLNVSHLDNFGNQNYDKRLRITEGQISGFQIYGSKANEYIFDDLKIIEAMPKTPTYAATVAPASSDNRLFANEAGAQTLYPSDFKISTTWKVNSSNTNEFMGIRLYGLNGSLGVSKDEYTLNAQAQILGLTMYPSFNFMNSGWKGHVGQTVQLVVGNTVEIVVEVLGDFIFMSIDNVLVLARSFTDMGIDKGHLQTIRLVNLRSDFIWTSLDYKSFDLSGSENYIQEVDSFVNQILTGEGLNAEGQCHAMFDILSTAYANLSEQALYILGTSSDLDVLAAIERYEYLDAWTKTNADPRIPPEDASAFSNKTNNRLASLFLLMFILVPLASLCINPKLRRIKK